jgi:hypothetical protein
MDFFKIQRLSAFILILLFVFGKLTAQTTREEIFATPEKSGGVNYAYPFRDITSQTPAPEGYKPFYISHFGRHGSRYLTDDKEYKHLLDVFHKADSCKALTVLGKDVLERLKMIWKEAEGHGGELTPLGISQQKNIAERMYLQYPEIFDSKAQISAVSTTVGRCVLSMKILCERLKELNPDLSIKQDSDPRHMEYLNHHTKQAVHFRYSNEQWKDKYKQFEKNHVRPERLIKSLFSDSDYPKENLSLVWELFSIASNLQNMQTKISLYDLFEKEELFDLWQCKNYSLYVQYANAAENNGMMMENAKPLLKNMIESANQIVETKGNGASFRFGHDGNIIPLAMLMHLQDCYNSVSASSEFYKAWSDFKVAPMAGNIQIIFFRKKDSDDILVKFLHNENEILVPPLKSDVLPYYYWKDAVKYYESLLMAN